MSNAITGKHESDVQLGVPGNTHGDTKGVVMVHSEEELKAKLKDLKERHQLPVVVKVSTFNEPFNSDSAGVGAGGEAGLHVVTITGYDEKTGNISVDNQWGKKADHGKDNPVSTHDMYIAMQTPQDAEKIIAADLKREHQQGVSDPIKELDYKRYEAQYGGVDGDSVGRTSIKNSIDEMQKRWAQGGVSDEEKAKETNALTNLITAMPIVDQAVFLQQAYRAHLLTAGQYENQLAALGMEVSPLTENHKVTEQARADLKAALGELSPEQQKAVLGQIDMYNHAVKHPLEIRDFDKELKRWTDQNNGLPQ